MVCSLGSGRMAVMARLLAAGNLSQSASVPPAEDVGQQNLAAQHIYRELQEADEANLLDEEDMYVFGLKPMTDPLHLVCCSACKKPVKASQFAAHAELCRSLNPAEEKTLNLDGGIGHRKPPRKEKKKLLSTYTNQATPIGEQERFESIDADDTAASPSQLDGEPGIPYSFSMDIKRNSSCVDVATMVDGKGVSPGNTDLSACIMPPPTKRSKFASGQHLPLLNGPETASCLTKATSIWDPSTCGDFQIQSTSGSEMPDDCVIVSKCTGQASDRCLQTKDIPVPLASKIYYSQRNNHLRAAVAYMYRVGSAQGLCSNVASPEESQDNILQLQASSMRGSSIEQAELLYNKRASSANKPYQILAQSSEMCLDKLGGCLPATNFSNQFPDDEIRIPQAASIGLLRSKHLSKPYSFAGGSGQSLGTMQQPNGSVPVL